MIGEYLSDPAGLGHESTTLFYERGNLRICGHRTTLSHGWVASTTSIVPMNAMFKMVLTDKVSQQTVW
jgi:hypothetical protein